MGRSAAEEALDEIAGYIEGSNMVFITAGMGGGTGTGAAPVVARLAKERGILTVGVVTKPFQFEGHHRMRLAEQGVQELQQFVDTLIVIPNQNLFRIANEKTTFADAFRMADEVLHSGVRGVTDLMIMPGLINLDFADIRTVMQEMGKAMMGTGEGEGPKRALEAAEAAISNPLLDDVSMKGARGVLINITGSYDMTLYEADEAATRIREEVDPNANIIFGATFNPALEGKIRVSVVATGIDAVAIAEPKPQPKMPDISRLYGGKIGFGGQRPGEAMKFPVTSPPPLRNVDPPVPAAHVQVPQAHVPAPAVTIPAPTPAATPAPAPEPRVLQQPQPPVFEKKPVTIEKKAPTLNADDASAVAFVGNMATAIGAVKYQEEAQQMPAPPLTAAGMRTPAFMSQPPVQPSQRSFFAMADDAEYVRKTAATQRNFERTAAPTDQKEKDTPAAGAMNFLHRMANVGKVLASKPEKPERSVQVVEKPKPEVTERSTKTAAATDNDYLEIPAFLRRQAN
jgi:cell division protein FtsZ